MIDSIANPNSMRSSIALDEAFRMQVLGPNEFTVDCNMLKRVGCRLIVELSAPVPSDSCIRIDCDDAFLLGEILGSWKEGSSTMGAIELQQAVVGLAELRSVCDVRGKRSDVQLTLRKLSA